MMNSTPTTIAVFLYLGAASAAPRQGRGGLRLQWTAARVTAGEEKTPLNDLVELAGRRR